MSEKWELKVHTCLNDGSQSDNSTGDDWSIYYDGKVILVEGNDSNLTLGEVRLMFETMKRSKIA